MSRKKIMFLIIILILLIGLIIPQKFTTPVLGSNSNSYNPKSFWYHPWGKSITHKGVDIFAKEGTTVNSSTIGIVVYKGQLNMGGNVIVVLGPKWRLHYYAHLKEITITSFSFLSINKKIGTVGSTGNAKGKSPHLHYSIVSIIPYPWRIDSEKQGWKKMFYLNPIEFLSKVTK